MSNQHLALPDRNGLVAPFAAIHHVALVTNDMAATVRFYRDVLGAEVAMTHRMPREGNERHYFITVAPNVVFAFFEFREAGTTPYLPATEAKIGRHLDHIAFFVPDEPALVRFREQLVGKADNLSPIRDLEIVKAFFFSDPNGIVLEVMAEIPGQMRFPIYRDEEPVGGLPTPGGSISRSERTRG